MIYNAKIEADVFKARERFKALIDSKKIFEIKEKRKLRTLSQNRYMHLILGWFGLHFGYTMEEVKQKIFKEHVNPELFYEGEKEGIVRIQQWRSTAMLNTDELSIAIDRFKKFSSEQGLYLPDPSDLASMQQIDNELNKYSSRQYM